MNLHLYKVTSSKGAALGSVSVVLARDSDYAKRFHFVYTGYIGESATRIEKQVKIFIEDRMQTEMVLYSWDGDY